MQTSLDINQCPASYFPGFVFCLLTGGQIREDFYSNYTGSLHLLFRQKFLARNHSGATWIRDNLCLGVGWCADWWTDFKEDHWATGLGRGRGRCWSFVASMVTAMVVIFMAAATATFSATSQLVSFASARDPLLASQIMACVPVHVFEFSFSLLVSLSDRRHVIANQIRQSICNCFFISHPHMCLSGYFYAEH